ncbi:hypothetical protein Q8A67_023844 [Cirrhinus molitorella]|uniref:Uncharacterized protein n=1 Tax=Cirrhinus molitorella TaxID=172907 RepID=A0AA88PEM1_9TELE|nr:hypothetical protein Q8A67_023844 [Cirrhinus molitorella]
MAGELRHDLTVDVRYGGAAEPAPTYQSSSLERSGKVALGTSSPMFLAARRRHPDDDQMSITASEGGPLPQRQPLTEQHPQWGAALPSPPLQQEMPSRSAQGEQRLVALGAH